MNLKKGVGIDHYNKKQGNKSCKYVQILQDLIPTSAENTN